MKTALITGASSGIGYELAKLFAEDKHNLVLVARREKQLNELAGDLQKGHGIKTKIIAKDLSKPNSAQEICDILDRERIAIDFLVNNAGFGDFCLFHQTDWNKMEQMINLNVLTLTHLTRLLVNPMISRKSGRILNLASTASFQPGPTMAVYCATKAYVLSFSEAIANELKGTGVTVTALCPGATESGFQKGAVLEKSKFVKGKKLASAESVAGFGYKALMKGKPVAIHGIQNWILANSVRFTPRKMVTAVTHYLLEESK
jgi:short-subunit dehydrogenase